MTTSGFQFHSQLLQLLLPVILVLILAAAAEGQRPGCRDHCGNISIPFPFGVGPGCFRDGFEVFCNDSSVPPRAFLAGNRTIKLMGEGNGDVYDPQLRTFEWSSSPFELVSISVATSEARVYAPVSYNCTDKGMGYTLSESTVQRMRFSGTPFHVSVTRNVLIGVGSKAEPQLTYYDDSLEFTPINYWVKRFSCHFEDFAPWESTPVNGSCPGPGCCVATLAPPLGGILSLAVNGEASYIGTPCAYGMLVEKSGYNFSTPDLDGYKNLLRRFPRGVPLALDFAAGDASCPMEGQPPPQDYACVSGNSSCANATYTYSPASTNFPGGSRDYFRDSHGYICKCLDHYAGNPYVPNGCQDIDECKQPEVYPCSNGGICKNRLGGYDCPCKFGMKGDGKAGTCTDILTPAAAKATVGAIGGVLLMVILSFLVILRKEKKKAKEFYKKNGGPTLEKANVIKLFKKDELKPILKNSNLIGKGCFGQVYKGLLDNKPVAIKKPINGSVLESEQFANEVIIQSQVIHKNIVRLIGCCLEVDAPMLVYEFISQGNLHDILHNNNNKAALNLDARLSIAAQSADGLAYMHSQANTRILHGDVKPANILLDENFAPKISDFGISRLLARDKERTASIIGDMNYMDPVYLQEGLLTEKSDVYSFGVVILELITSRRAIHSENNSLVKSFLEAHKEQKKVTELFDKKIAIEEDVELLDSLAGMAMECLSLDVDQRPTMMDLAQRLHILSRSRKVQDVCH